MRTLTTAIAFVRNSVNRRAIQAMVIRFNQGADLTSPHQRS